MTFRDRDEAGRLLADRLLDLRGKDAVVLGLPRGGLVVARHVADGLGLPLDFIVTRKLGAPGNEELAIGAVTAHGVRVLNDFALRQELLPPGYLDAETHRQRQLAVARDAQLRGIARRHSLAGKLAIIVDDGIATGMTMLAAIAEVRAFSPREIVVAAPVTAPDTYVRLKNEVENVVTLEMPERFESVGQFFLNFEQVTDEQVKTLLRQRVR
jgi:putative phosphoribosyl transferase